LLGSEFHWNKAKKPTHLQEPVYLLCSLSFDDIYGFTKYDSEVIKVIPGKPYWVALGGSLFLRDEFIHF
jgi:hypothetical protein